MVKHTQTIRREQPMNCLSMFDHLVGLAFKGLKQMVKIVKIKSGLDINWKFVTVIL